MKIAEIKKDIKIDFILIPIGFLAFIISIVYSIFLRGMENQSPVDIPVIIAILGASLLLYGIISLEGKKKRIELQEIKELLVEKEKEKEA